MPDIDIKPNNAPARPEKNIRPYLETKNDKAKRQVAIIHIAQYDKKSPFRTLVITELAVKVNAKVNGMADECILCRIPIKYRQLFISKSTSVNHP